MPEKTANLWLSWDATPQLRASGGVRYVGRRFVEASHVPPSHTADEGELIAVGDVS